MRPLLLIALLISCSEYQIHDPDHVAYAVPNPRPLENEWVEDVFAHPTPVPVDILVAVDKSCSMGNNRAEWNANMPVFIQILEDNYIDYHLGVISTDTGDKNTVGQLPWWGGVQWASMHDVSPSATFIGLESMAWGGGEAGLDAVRGAMFLRPTDGNEGFLRQGAPLHIVTISDEPDQSIWTSPKRMVKALDRYRSENNSLVSYSIITHTPNSNFLGCSVSEALWGWGYLEVAWKWPYGRIIDICESDWSQPIQDIADMIGQNIQYEYYLHDIPIEDSIEVLVIEEVNGQDVTFVFDHVDDWQEGDSTIRGYQMTWYYDSARNSIVFPEFIPEYDTEVRVGYYKASTYNEENE